MPTLNPNDVPMMSGAIYWCTHNSVGTKYAHKYLGDEKWTVPSNNWAVVNSLMEPNSAYNETWWEVKVVRGVKLSDLQPGGTLLFQPDVVPAQFAVIPKEELIPGGLYWCKHQPNGSGPSYAHKYMGDGQWSPWSANLASVASYDEVNLAASAICQPYALVLPEQIAQWATVEPKPKEKIKYRILNAPTHLNPEECFRTF